MSGSRVLQNAAVAAMRCESTAHHDSVCVDSGFGVGGTAGVVGVWESCRVRSRGDSLFLFLLLFLLVLVIVLAIVFVTVER